MALPLVLLNPVRFLDVVDLLGYDNETLEVL
jgi:hypothetical protein